MHRAQQTADLVPFVDCHDILGAAASSFDLARQHLADATIAIVLAGGRGERLQPLTLDRAKPAVPFGAGSRIIDFTLANCVRSGIPRVHLLAQYQSASLSRYVDAAWSGQPQRGDRGIGA